MEEAEVKLETAEDEEAVEDDEDVKDNWDDDDEGVKDNWDASSDEEGKEGVSLYFGSILCTWGGTVA